MQSGVYSRCTPESGLSDHDFASAGIRQEVMVQKVATVEWISKCVLGDPGNGMKWVGTATHDELQRMVGSHAAGSYCKASSYAEHHHAL